MLCSPLTVNSACGGEEGRHLSHRLISHVIYSHTRTYHRIYYRDMFYGNRSGDVGRRPKRSFVNLSAVLRVKSLAFMSINDAPVSFLSSRASVSCPGSL